MKTQKYSIIEIEALRAAETAIERDEANVRADFADLATDRRETKIAELRGALEHALRFIEHSHPNFDEPIENIDSFTNSVDDGPEIECNLAMLREALKEAK